MFYLEVDVKIQMFISQQSTSCNHATHLTLVDICVHGHVPVQVFAVGEDLFTDLTLMSLVADLPFLQLNPETLVLVQQLLPQERPPALVAGEALAVH